MINDNPSKSDSPDTPAPDEISMVLAARKDPKAFGALYLRYVDQVYRYLYSKLNNLHEAEDLTARTFLAAFESFHSLRHPDHFPAWLFTIARNKAMDHFRKSRLQESPLEPNDLVVNEDPLVNIIHAEQALALSRLIRRLTEEEQELLRLRFLGDMSYIQIGRILNRNEDAVKKATHRLLARLQSQLEEPNV